MKLITLALTLLTTVAAHGNEGTRGGGDLCEKRIQTVRDDITSWIAKGGNTKLALGSISTSSYADRMNSAFGSAKIRCVSEGDKGYPVEINRTPKECRFDQKGRSALITCDRKKLEARSESDQYILVHHEYAGIAGLEMPAGDVSSYWISNQISAFLVDETVKRLAVAPKPPVQPELVQQLFQFDQAKQMFAGGSATSSAQVLGTWRLVANVNSNDPNNGWYIPERGRGDGANSSYALVVSNQQGMDGSAHTYAVYKNICTKSDGGLYSTTPATGKSMAGSFQFPQELPAGCKEPYKGFYYENNCRLIKGQTDRMICQRTVRVTDSSIDLPPPGFSNMEVDLNATYRLNGTVISYSGFVKN